MKITIKKKIGAAATAVAIVGGAGIATAYWTSTGTGSGSATAGTSSPWAVSTDAATTTPPGSPATPALPLTPGGPTSTVAFHVKNNNSGNQKLASVSISVANSDGTPWTAAPGCSAADFNVGGAGAGLESIQSPNIDLAAGATHDGTVTLQMVNRNASQDACKNAIVPLFVSAS